MVVVGGSEVDGRRLGAFGVFPSLNVIPFFKSCTNLENPIC